VKVEIRPIESGDAEQLARIANNVKIRDAMRTGFPHPYTLEDAKTFIEVCHKAKHLPRAIVVDGLYAGQIGIFPREIGDAEIGYWLGEEYWGRGVITQAIALIVKLAKEIVKPTEIYAKVIKDNVGSWKALEKNGFVFISEIDERCNEWQSTETLLYKLRMV